MLVRALGIIAVCAVPCLLIFAVAAHPLLKIAFGAKRANASDSLFVLGCAFTVLAATYLAVQYMLALKRTWFLVVIGAVAVAEPVLLLNASRKPAGFAGGRAGRAGDRGAARVRDRAPAPRRRPADAGDHARRRSRAGPQRVGSPSTTLNLGGEEMAVVKIIELVGSSATSSDDAVKAALKDAQATLRNIKAVDVVSVGLRGDNLEEWRAHVRVAFLIERVSE